MSWPVWPKGNEKALAGYASATTAHIVRLASPTADALAKGDLRGVVQELYDAFLGMDIRWSQEMYQPEEALQQIRPPHTILEGAGDGTCLDLAVLMAGAALGKELLPVVVVLDGHALLAVSNRTGRRKVDSYARRDREKAFFTDGVAKGDAAAARLRELVDGGEYTLVECTGFARVSGALDDRTPEGKGRVGGVMPFARAIQAGREQLDVAGREFVFAIDVAYLQDIVRVEQYAAADDGTSRIDPDLRRRYQRLMDDYGVVGGREAELDQLNRFLTTQPSGYCIVTGAPGSGKTALLAEWIRRLSVVAQRKTVYHFLSRQYGTADRQSEFLQSLLQQASWAWGARPPQPNSIGMLEAAWLELLDPERPPNQPVVVVIDGADEADGWALNRSMFPRRLPVGVHVVISARAMAGTDWREELGIPQAETIALKGLGDEAVRAVLDLVGAPAWLTEPDAFAVLTHSVEGDPFYLRLICNQTASGEITSIDDLAEAPRGLEAFIKKWWEDVQQSADQPGVQCLLSYLTVALAPMTRAELVDIDPDDALGGLSFDATLEKVERYIAGEPDDVGISFAHWRLKDFISRKVLSASEVGKATETVVAWCDRWREHHFRYALAKGFAHHFALAEAATGEQRAAYYRDLVTTVRDNDYQVQRAEKISDASGLVADMSRLCVRLSADGVDDVASVVAIALIYVDARARLLHPGLVFSLARNHLWEDAVARLDLLPASEFWRAAARLCIGWLAAGTGESAVARRLLEEDTPGSDVLAHIADRLRGELTASEPPVPAGLAADFAVLDAANAILERLASREDLEGGVEYPAAAVHSDRAEAGIDPDSRTMVEAARQHPGQGRYLLETYIGQIGANPYSDYRNRSLAYLLDEVSRLPDPIDARELSILLVSTALQPSPLRFSEHVRMSHGWRNAQSTNSGPGGSSQSWLKGAGQLMHQAEQVLAEDEQYRRGPRSDLWAFLRRRMAAFAETLDVTPDGHAQAERLLDLAARIESGFAGFRVPAFLAIVEANAIVRPADHEAQRSCLERAWRAAHNIQDMSFCARSTAMVNRTAQRQSNGPPGVGELVAEVQRFVASPARTVEFGSLHVIGESFAWRRRRDHLSVDEVSRARTLEQLAHRIFQVPIAMMERANPGVGRADELNPGAEVAVPDSAFVPMTATWLAAHLMSAELADEERARLLAHLVPITLPNPTALDAVLGRLVAVAPNVDLDRVADVLPLAQTFEPSTSWVEYPGGYS